MGKLYFQHSITCTQCEPKRQVDRIQTRSLTRLQRNPTNLSCQYCGNKQVYIKFKAKLGNRFELKDKTVGSASLNYERGKTWIIENVFVSTKFRRQGIARSLIKRIIEVGRKSRRIRLEVFPFGKNQGANSQQLVEFYASLGFRGDENEMILKN